MNFTFSSRKNPQSAWFWCVVPRPVAVLLSPQSPLATKCTDVQGAVHCTALHTCTVGGRSIWNPPKSSPRELILLMGLGASWNREDCAMLSHKLFKCSPIRSEAERWKGKLFSDSFSLATLIWVSSLPTSLTLSRPLSWHPLALIHEDNGVSDKLHSSDKS